MNAKACSATALAVTTSVLLGCGTTEEKGYRFKEVMDDGGTQAGRAVINDRKVDWIYDNKGIGTVSTRYESCNKSAEKVQMLCTEQAEAGDGGEYIDSGLVLITVQDNGDVVFFNNEINSTTTVREAADKFSF